MPRIDWLASLDEFSIHRGLLHVWRLCHEPHQSASQALWELLSADELKRAERFVFDKDRNMYVAVRGTLRTLLSFYSDTDPKYIEFSYNPYGKPFLKYPQSNLQFNVSHSQNIAVVLIASQVVGIDVEFQNAKFSSKKIAERFFSTQEVEDLQLVQDDQLVKPFFDCWSLKESYIKAKGMGVSLPLESFTTRSDKNGQAMLVESRQFPQDVDALHMVSFSPAPFFSGAITAEKPVDTIRYFDMNTFIKSRLETS